MKRIRLTVAYDGTAYCGFQLQPELPTVEGELNRALTELTGETVTVTGASRTDSGVHARGNVAVFDTDSPIPGERFFAALNTKLPRDIRAVSSCEVPADWHPRKQDCVKTYEYRIDTSYTADPMKRLYTMHWPRKTDVEAMKRAARYLVGEHDFTSFANPSSQVLREGGSPVRTVYEISVSAKDGEILIRVRGNGFLYNMVRIIAGTLLEVGSGRFSPDEVKSILEAGDRTRAGMTAEPQGLVLDSISYEK